MITVIRFEHLRFTVMASINSEAGKNSQITLSWDNFMQGWTKYRKSRPSRTFIGSGTIWRDASTHHRIPAITSNISESLLSDIYDHALHELETVDTEKSEDRRALLRVAGMRTSNTKHQADLVMAIITIGKIRGHDIEKELIDIWGGDQ